MLNMTTIKVDVVGRTLGASTTYIMDPVIIFKGKLMAAANRKQILRHRRFDLASAQVPWRAEKSTKRAQQAHGR